MLRLPYAQESITAHNWMRSSQRHGYFFNPTGGLGKCHRPCCTSMILCECCSEVRDCKNMDESLQQMCQQEGWFSSSPAQRARRGDPPHVSWSCGDAHPYPPPLSASAAGPTHSASNGSPRSKRRPWMAAASRGVRVFLFGRVGGAYMMYSVHTHRHLCVYAIYIHTVYVCMCVCVCAINVSAYIHTQILYILYIYMCVLYMCLNSRYTS